jgi:predicted transcriptional regulator of viral defense system
MQKKKERAAFQLAKRTNGYFKANDLKMAGLNVYDINSLLDMGKIERIKRGFYKWLGMPEETSEMVDVARLVPGGVFCLFSALAWHELTTYIPKEYNMAIYIYSRKPALPQYPPIKLYYFSDKRFELGVKTVELDGHEIRIFDLEKTICDVIHYRNKLGIDIVKEALDKYKTKRERNIQKLMQYANDLRDGTVLQKYLEVLI